MSRTYFAFALPVVVCATPALAQYYPPAPPPSYYYERGPAPPPAYSQPGGYYQQQPQPAYRPAPQPYYEDPREQARPAQPVAAPDDGPAMAPPLQPATDRLEQMLWQAAAQANSIDGYATYLNRYRDGPHSGEARTAVEQIRRNPPPPRVAVAEPAVETAPTPAPVKEVAAAAPTPTAAPITVASATLTPAKAVAKSAIVAGGKTLPIATIATAAIPVAPNDAIDAAPVPAAKPVPAPIKLAQATPVAMVGTAAVTAAIQAEANPAPFVCRPVYAGEAPFDQAGEQEIGAYLAAIRMNSIGAYETYLQAYPHGVFAPEVLELVASRQGRIATLAKSVGAGAVAARARGQVVPTESDYPTMALRDGQEGKATAIWEVAEDGCVEACRIDRSSGSPALDAASCRAITSRGRYDPALDAQGHPVRSIDSATFTWKLPTH